MTLTVAILSDKPMREASLLDVLIMVGIILFGFAGLMMWTAARSHANRDKRPWFPPGDFGIPSHRWPWVLSYVFLAMAGLLFILGQMLWN